MHGIHNLSRESRNSGYANKMLENSSFAFVVRISNGISNLMGGYIIQSDLLLFRYITTHLHLL